MKRNCDRARIRELIEFLLGQAMPSKRSNSEQRHEIYITKSSNEVRSMMQSRQILPAISRMRTCSSSLEASQGVNNEQ